MFSRTAPRRFRHLGMALLAILILVPFFVIEAQRRPEQPAATQAPPTVDFSLPSGSYDQDIRLSLTSPDPAAAVYFSTDGSLPTAENGTPYSGPIYLPATPPRVAVVRARAIGDDGSYGPLQTASYALGLEHDLPLISLVAEPADLWDDVTGILTNPLWSGRDWERPAEVFFLEPDGSGFHAPVGIRVHGAASRLYEKKGLRFYFRDDYGLPVLHYPILPDSGKSDYDRLVLHNGGQDLPAISVNGTLLRNQLAGNLARQWGVIATYLRPVLVFLNGEMMGVYLLRERIDGDYMAENFAIEDADILTGFEHRLDAVEGDRLHWENLLDFVTTNDLRSEDNMTYVETQMNMDNFVDYVAFQIISANSDWPHNNQFKFRDRAFGRWHWMLWDSDFAFGLNPDSYVEKDMFLHLLANDGLWQKEAGLFFRKIFENPRMRDLLLTRLADQLNTIFLPDNVLKEIDNLAGALANDIDYETRRWPGPGDWTAGVSYMRDFARERPGYVRQHAVDYFDLPGTAVLRIEAGQNNSGGVIVNERIILESQDLPWEGIYFQGPAVQVTAVPAPGYQFAGWEPASLPQTPSLTLELSSDLALTPRFESGSGN